MAAPANSDRVVAAVERANVTRRAMDMGGSFLRVWLARAVPRVLRGPEAGCRVSGPDRCRLAFLFAAR